MTKKADKLNPADLVEVTGLFDRDLEELADDKPALEKIITHLRKQRENVAAAEQAGKRITKKVATGKASKPFSLDSPLSLLGQ